MTSTATTATTAAPAPKRTRRALFAGAAAVALLTAGGGSFAMWQDTADVSTGATITSGTLDLTPATAGTWTYAGTAQTPSLIVPGDTLTYTQDVQIDLTGDNLAATLTADLSALGIPADGNNSTLVNALDATLKVDGAEGPSFSKTVTSEDEDKTLTVEVTVTFDEATTGQNGQNQQVTLKNLPIVLTQVEVPASA